MLRELMSLTHHRRGRNKLVLFCLAIVTGIALTSIRSYLRNREGYTLFTNQRLYGSTNNALQHPYSRPSRPFFESDAQQGKDFDMDGDDFTMKEIPYEQQLQMDDVPELYETRKDGLVESDPFGPHPIYQLIKNAEKRWAEKKASASMTLDQAVKEYVRRYKRPPPLGFEHWWKYARENDVQLPDEYDTIYQDLEPFWGIDPVYLNDTIGPATKSYLFSYVLAKKDWDSPIEVVDHNMPPERFKDTFRIIISPLIALLDEVVEFIPPFRATFSSSDNPEFLLDHSLKGKALEAAANGDVLRFEDMPRPKDVGFGTMCPPDSPLALNPPAIAENPPFRTEKTFVQDIEAAADPCQNPHLVLVHGQYTRHRQQPKPYRPLSPTFAHCKTSLHSDIRVTPLYLTHQYIHNDHAWADKTNDKLLWRGSISGAWHSVDKPWRHAHRARLLNVTTTKPTPVGEGSFPLDIELLPPALSDDAPVGNPQKVSRKALSADKMDIGLVGDNLHCEPDVCELLHRVFRYPDRVDDEASKEYKYVLDVDGHGWSGRFHRLMSMNSAVFKGTLYPEWFTGRLEPWVHYIPIQVDYSDLYDTFVFFAGDHQGRKGREDLAEKIGAEGRDWTETFWRPEDMRAYMFRLLLEYARVMHPNRTEMYYGSPKTALDFD